MVPVAQSFNRALMSILFRYILRRFASTFALCLGILILILFMNKFLGLFNMAVMKGVPLTWIFSSFALLMPYFLSLTLPLAYLIAVIVTLDQFVRGDELLALRAAGFSFFDFLRPFLALGVALSAVMLFVNHKLAPEDLHFFHTRYAAASRRVSRVELEPGTFSTVGRWRIYAASVDRESGRLTDAYLLEWQNDNPLVVKAPRGLFLGEGSQSVLELYDGSLIAPSRDPGRISVGKFKRCRIGLSGAPSTSLMHQGPKETQSRDMLGRMKALPAHSEGWNRFALEISLRCALALAPFVFCLVEVPLFFCLQDRRRILGFLGGLLVMFLFYWLLAYGAGLGRRRPELVLFAPWLGNLAGLLAGSILSWRASRI
jgi:lipopolysaccharide export system permease protein